jgi:hypothetical protein
MKNNAFVRALCRVLIAGMAWLPLQSQAELVATTRAVSAAQADSARTSIASQLEALGVPADSAQQRAAALSDAEALELVARVDASPAGAMAWPIVLLAAFLIWRFTVNYQAEQKAQPAPKEPAKK